MPTANMDSSTLVKIIVLFLCGTLHWTHAQVPQGGRCPANVETVQDLSVERYLGRWYEYSKYPFIFEFNGKCIYAEYGQLANGDVSVYNFNKDKLTGTNKDIRGTATVTGPGKLSVTFSGMPAFLGGAPYWVLGTDYSNYAVVYSCSEFFGLLHTEVVWILTRERVPAPEIVQTARDIITRNGLSLKPLEQTDQQNCGSN